MLKLATQEAGGLEQQTYDGQQTPEVPFTPENHETGLLLAVGVQTPYSDRSVV